VWEGWRGFGGSDQPRVDAEVDAAGAGLQLFCAVLGWIAIGKSLNGRIDEWWSRRGPARSRRDAAALALDSSLCRRFAAPVDCRSDL
jgi:hypothetical protein